MRRSSIDRASVLMKVDCVRELGARLELSKAGRPFFESQFTFCFPGGSPERGFSFFVFVLSKGHVEKRRRQACSERVKQAVVEALSGPEQKRRYQVENSIRRGRISQWQHHKDESEDQTPRGILRPKWERNLGWRLFCLDLEHRPVKI